MVLPYCEDHRPVLFFSKRVMDYDCFYCRMASVAYDFHELHEKVALTLGVQIRKMEP